jgi:ATP-dependent helicase/nuclease subunit B
MGRRKPMSLQFIIGRAGSGKSTTCLDYIRKELQKDPQGPPILYLVPDQMTFQAEYTLVSTPGLSGMIRAQAFSFSRLALRVLQEAGGISRYHLNKVGLSMILRKIVEQRKQELRVFQKSSEQQGFYEHLEQMITEFKRYCHTPEQIENLFNGNRQKEDEQKEPSEGKSPLLLDKLHDLHLIYSEFEQYLLGRYVDSEDYLKLLVGKIPQSRYLEQAEIIVDGFYHLTPQELEVLQALIKYCPRVKVAITLDREYDHDLPHELDLFNSTAKTYQQIRELAINEKIRIDPAQVQEGTIGRFQQQSSLAHIEYHYDHRPVVPFLNDSVETGVKLAATVNRRTEVEGVARQILHLVRDKGYRWRDMAILVRDLSPYQDFLENIFEDYQIPIFIDQKRSMLNHPLIEFIRSSLDVISQFWRYEAVFRCVKTELLFSWDDTSGLHQLREEMDQLENYVLAHGINGSRWTEQQEWVIQDLYSLEEDKAQTVEQLEQQKRLNELRAMIVQPLLALQQKLTKKTSVRSICEELFFYLEEAKVPEKLESWKVQAELQGNLRAAREHEQVWGAVIELLDQLVEMLGDEELSLEMFIKLVETGCESMRFALVPPAMDQVVVGSIDRSRYSNVKCAFILGVNDGRLPAKPKEEGLMTEEEREGLARIGMNLAPTSRYQLAIEEFYIYVALSSASDQLWLSYAMADEEGKSLTPSILINRMKQLFPNLKEQMIVHDLLELKEEMQLSYIVNPKISLTYLANQLRHWKRGYPIAPFWWDVYNWLTKHEDWKRISQTILSSLFYTNKANPLSSETSQALYGKHIQASVSRMERYKSCPFSQFISHGLRLKERRIFRLEAPDIGQLFHAALKLIDDQLRKLGKEWKDLDKQECQRLAQEVVDKLAPRLQGKILLSSNRHHYIKRKLQQVVERATMVLSEHSKGSQFTPVGLEIDFGPSGPLPSMRFVLNNGATMEVVGRIDRVDKATGSQGLLLRVIDYKSSQTALNLGEVYYGLSLQILTYLDVIITHSKEWLGVQASPAGVLYFHIHNPMLSKKTALPQEQIERELYRRFKMKGFVLANQEAVQLMDLTLESQHSDVIPVALKKDGAFYSSSSVASEEDFTQLRRYVREQIQQIGTEITDGVIKIAPFKMKKKVACTFCSYKPVCQFDQELEENEFLNFPQFKKEKVLEQIRLEGGEK